MCHPHNERLIVLHLLYAGYCSVVLSSQIILTHISLASVFGEPRQTVKTHIAVSDQGICTV